MFFYKQNEVKAASYSRLSREDGDKMESDSIRNQKDLIADYAAQRGIRIVSEYTDDGYSGTNFDRPNFQRMMEDVKKKKINCIIVKDLSRLGRNYIETGRYLEKIFPFLGVRFIAINDHYDSADESGDADQIVIPFKNLIKNTPPSGRVNSRIHPIAPTNRYTTVTSCRTCPSTRIFSPTTTRSTSSSSSARSTSSTAVYFRTADTHF